MEIEMNQISPLKLSEHAAWLALWRAYQEFYRVELPAAVTEATWTRLHDGRIHGFGAHADDGELIGIVHFLFHEDTWSTQPACYLQDLYVTGTARGTGSGRLLIEAVAGAARSAGAGNLYWLTHETNATARRLYDRLASNQGFIHYAYSLSSPA
jgi:GNAT superfamily N-acetyltransferase